MGPVNRILEITFVLVLAYLVIANAQNFSVALATIGGVYANSVKTLQGR
jgi:hypothetical protein